MSEKETLHFKIGISGTYWDKKPHYTVWLDDQKYADATIGGHSKEIEFVEFDVDVTQGLHEFKIRLENKSCRDTETDGNGNIINDMLLNIESIEIDEINLDNLMWSVSEFIPDHPQKMHGETVSSLKNCVNLGWNGTYVIKFESPFYIWLIESLWVFSLQLSLWQQSKVSAVMIAFGSSGGLNTIPCYYLNYTTGHQVSHNHNTQ